MSAYHPIARLHDLPLALLEPLAERSVASLRLTAQENQQAWLYADLSKCRTLNAIMHRLQDLLHLPAYFGFNLDALYDALTEMTPPASIHPGFMVVFESILSAVPKADRTALLGVLQQVGEDFTLRGIAYRVYYSQADQD